MSSKITDLTSLTSGLVDRATDVIEIADVSASTSKKITPNALMGIAGAAVGDTDSQTLTNKTITAPNISSPVLSGTLTGTYTIAGTPTFPAAVVTLTGSQTLTNKVLTSPTINTATISNPTLTVDTVSEFTAANGVTIDGLNIKDSKLNTTDSVVTSNITAGAVTTTKITYDGAQAYRNSTQNITTTTFTPVQFNNENFDTSSYHDNVTNNTRMTVTSAGYYLCHGGVEYSANITGQRYLWFSRNATTTERYGEQLLPSSAAVPFTMAISAVVYMSAAGYIEMYAYQNSGSTLTLYVGDSLATMFTITRLGS